MKFSCHKNTAYDINIRLNNVLLQAVDSHKHLDLILIYHLDFDLHIDNIIRKCSRWIGVIWKLQRKYPRHSLENIYLSYIRPVIEYCHIIYDNTSEKNAQRLESLQRKAAIACTGAYVNTSHNRLLHELGWPSLRERRKNAKLIMAFKLVNNLTPPYLTGILPPTRQQSSTYQLRNPQDITIPHTRLQLFKKSFLPSSIALWNSLSEDTKAMPTLPAFKRRIKPSFTRSKAFSMGRGKGSINLTRIRLNMSGLNSHLYNVGIKDSNKCNCNNHCVEDPTHFFWKCPQYAAPRNHMIQQLTHAGVIPNIQDMTNPGNEQTNTILNGVPANTDTQNRTLFTIIEQYILSTGRLT